jgi:hypothetical protein
MFSAGPALAAKGGRFGGSGGTSATLTATPNPARAYTPFTISGSGFNGNSWVIVGPVGIIPFAQVMTDASGSFSVIYTRLLPPDTYSLEAYQEKSRSWELKASITFTVAP